MVQINLVLFHAESLWIWRASSTSHFNSAPCEPMHLGGMMVEILMMLVVVDEAIILTTS